MLIFLIVLIYYKQFDNNDKYTKRIPVLMYHNVVDKDILKHYTKKEYQKIFISTDKFEQQMKFIKTNNYKTLTLDEFYDFVQGNKNLPQKCVLITFDDGRKNLYVKAYPILKKYNLNAVSFIITSKISKQSEEYNPLKWQYLSESELEKGKDVFEYASHTHDMHKRSKNTQKPYLKIKSEKEIKEDIQKSLKYVDNPYFAYPYGSYTNNIKKILQEAGIKAAFTTKKGKVSINDSLYDLKRYGISEKTTNNQFAKILGVKN